MNTLNSKLTSVYSGDSALDDYITRLTTLIQLLDYTQEPSPEYCQRCFEAGHSIRQSLGQWLSNQPGLMFELTGQSLGVYDFKILGSAYLSRVTVPVDISEHAPIVIYYGEGNMTAVPYRGDVKTSIYSARALWEV